MLTSRSSAWISELSSPVAGLLLHQVDDQEAETARITDGKDVWADEATVSPLTLRLQSGHVGTVTVARQGGLDEEEDDSFWASTHGKSQHS